MEDYRNPEMTFRRYLITAIPSILLFTAIAMLVDIDLTKPTLVGTGMAILLVLTEAFVWRWVAKKSPESLPTFYSSMSLYRMIIAAFVALVSYLIVDKEDFRTYILLILLFYLVTLVHHSIFFLLLLKKSAEIDANDNKSNNNNLDNDNNIDENEQDK